MQIYTPSLLKGKGTSGDRACGARSAATAAPTVTAPDPEARATVGERRATGELARAHASRRRTGDPSHLRRRGATTPLLPTFPLRVSLAGGHGLSSPPAAVAPPRRGDLEATSPPGCLRRPRPAAPLLLPFPCAAAWQAGTASSAVVASPARRPPRPPHALCRNDLP
jgi:hypothetical protein